MYVKVTEKSLAQEIDLQANNFGFPSVWAAAAVYGDAVQKSFLHSLPHKQIDPSLYSCSEPHQKTSCIGQMIDNTFMYRAGFGIDPMVRAVLRTQDMISVLSSEPTYKSPAGLWQERLNQIIAWQNTDERKLKQMCFRIRAAFFDKPMHAVPNEQQRQKVARKIEHLTFGALDI